MKTIIFQSLELYSLEKSTIFYYNKRIQNRCDEKLINSDLQLANNSALFSKNFTSFERSLENYKFQNFPSVSSQRLDRCNGKLPKARANIATNQDYSRRGQRREERRGEEIREVGNLCGGRDESIPPPLARVDACQRAKGAKGGRGRPRKEWWLGGKAISWEKGAGVTRARLTPWGATRASESRDARASERASAHTRTNA